MKLTQPDRLPRPPGRREPEPGARTSTHPGEVPRPAAARKYLRRPATWLPSVASSSPGLLEFAFPGRGVRQRGSARPQGLRKWCLKMKLKARIKFSTAGPAPSSRPMSDEQWARKGPTAAPALGRGSLVKEHGEQWCGPRLLPRSRPSPVPKQPQVPAARSVRGRPGARTAGSPGNAPSPEEMATPRTRSHDPSIETSRQEIGQPSPAARRREIKAEPARKQLAETGSEVPTRALETSWFREYGRPLPATNAA